jgi:hypothetical protein
LVPLTLSCGDALSEVPNPRAGFRGDGYFCRFLVPRHPQGWRLSLNATRDRILRCRGSSGISTLHSRCRASVQSIALPRACTPEKCPQHPSGKWPGPGAVCRGLLSPMGTGCTDLTTGLRPHSPRLALVARPPNSRPVPRRLAPSERPTAPFSAPGKQLGQASHGCPGRTGRSQAAHPSQRGRIGPSHFPPKPGSSKRLSPDAPGLDGSRGGWPLVGGPREPGSAQ